MTPSRIRRLRRGARKPLVVVEVEERVIRDDSDLFERIDRRMRLMGRHFIVVTRGGGVSVREYR